MDRVVEDVISAVDRADWDGLRPLLHPYLHWRVGERTTRGRVNVLRLLRADPRVTEPSSYELRDGQVYRWDMSAE